MDISHFLFDGSRKYEIGAIDPGDTRGLDKKTDGKRLLEGNREAIARWQDALYAEDRQSLLVILQAMDAAGKDGTVKHVFTGVNPQGISVTSFKGPSQTELSHDYLWRIHKAAPKRGMIGIFNRSHYEDVLIGRVLDLPRSQNLPHRTLSSLWEKRYRQIRDFEQMLYENGTTIVKIHLCLSKEEQAERFRARLEDPAKNWKFSKGDLDTREHWDAYQRAYVQAIDETACPHAPWYVVPADHKWYTRAVVSAIVLDALGDMHPRYPQIDESQRRELAECKARLL